MGQAESSSIPMLTDVLVPGKPSLARASAAELPHDDAAIPVLTDVVTLGKPALARAPAEADAVVIEPVPTPDVPAIEWPPAVSVAAEPEPKPMVESPAVVSDVSDAAAPAAEAVVAADVGRIAHEAAAVEPLALTPVDAQHIAERLRNRLTGYLTGEGRDAIEARCRAALDDHTARLVSQITREVALALETQVMEWVRDAVDDEIARRRPGQSG